jgi:hypothetical protein
LVEISYPKLYKKRFWYNTLFLGTELIIFPVEHHESVFDLLTNIPQFTEPSKYENFTHAFRKYIKNYKGMTKMCFIHVAVKIPLGLTNLVSYFPAREYNVIYDLEGTIMYPANCRSSTWNLITKDNFNFVQPETVYVYTVIMKRNLVGDSYVRLLTSLHFPSNTCYHRFD